MKKQRSLWGRCSVLAIGVLAVASACSKRAAQPQPTSVNSAPSARPAAPKDEGSKAAAQGQNLATGIDLGRLDALERKVFDQVVGREPSACGKGHSLLHSIEHDKSCRASFYAVRYIARLADAGLSEGEIAEKVEQRFRAPRIPHIDLSQAPSKGAPSGRVKVVEFSDYQCGHCKDAQALLHQLLAEYPKDLTVYFKHFPLSGHANSLNAAIGATAAQAQGKFWQFNDKVWESSENLTTALLESIAKEIGLDFPRWYDYLSSNEVRSQVVRDRAEARSLEIRRTPGIFINGRRYTDEIDLVGLRDWIDEELGR